MKVSTILSDVITRAVRMGVTKVRFLEAGKSIEDFTISYKVDGTAIVNFTIIEKGSKVEVRKNNKNSKKHLSIDNIDLNAKAIDFEIKESGKKKTAMMLVDLPVTISYADGTHRYNK